MEKTNVNTALAIVFIASAVMLIGGLAATTLITTAMADQPDFAYCRGMPSAATPTDSVSVASGR